MYELKEKKYLNLILYFSIFSIVFAYYVEFGLGHKPCNLCLLERVPYFLTIIIIIFISIIKRYEKILFFIIFIIFLLSTFLSLYHVGIERGLIEESSLCSSNSNLDVFDKEQLKKELSEMPISCKNITFSIFGLSLATINTFVSFVISLITFNKFSKYEKK